MYFHDSKLITILALNVGGKPARSEAIKISTPFGQDKNWLWSEITSTKNYQWFEFGQFFVIQLIWQKIFMFRFCETMIRKQNLLE